MCSTQADSMKKGSHLHFILLSCSGLRERVTSPFFNLRLIRKQKKGSHLHFTLLSCSGLQDRVTCLFFDLCLIRKHCELDSEASGFLEHAMTQQNFSADRAMWS
jgi:hypothetical protein